MWGIELPSSASTGGLSFRSHERQWTGRQSDCLASELHRRTKGDWANCRRYPRPGHV